MFFCYHQQGRVKENHLIIFQIFCACIDNTFLVPNESHNNCWGDSQKKWSEKRFICISASRLSYFLSPWVALNILSLYQLFHGFENFYDPIWVFVIVGAHPFTRSKLPKIQLWDGGQEQPSHLILLLAAMIFTSSLCKKGSTWKIHKYLTFKPRSSQIGRWPLKKGTPIQNERIETYGSILEINRFS